VSQLFSRYNNMQLQSVQQHAASANARARSSGCVPHVCAEGDRAHHSPHQRMFWPRRRQQHLCAHKETMHSSTNDSSSACACTSRQRTSARSSECMAAQRQQQRMSLRLPRRIQLLSQAHLCCSASAVSDTRLNHVRPHHSHQDQQDDTDHNVSSQTLQPRGELACTSSSLLTSLGSRHVCESLQLRGQWLPCKSIA
jgi:hypothetical protein